MAEFANNWGDRTIVAVDELTGHLSRSIKQFATDYAEVIGG